MAHPLWKVWKLPLKLNTLPVWPRNLTLMFTWEKWTMCPHIGLHTSICIRFIYNCSKPETTQMSFKQWAVNTWWSIYTVEHSSTHKRNTLLTQAMARVNQALHALRRPDSEAQFTRHQRGGWGQGVAETPLCDRTGLYLWRQWLQASLYLSEVIDVNKGKGFLLDVNFTVSCSVLSNSLQAHGL